MSYAEIAKEMEEDFKNVQKYQIHLPVKKYIREALSRPSNGKVIFKTVEWTSPKHNKMLLTPISKNRQMTKRFGPMISVCCIFLYKGELCLAAQSGTVLPWIHVQFFTHHFFQRYNERYLKEPGMEMMDIIKRFIHNEFADSFSKLVRHPKLGIESFSAFPHGCTFSEIAEHDSYILHHTFVVDDMLHTDQLLTLALLRYEQLTDEQDKTSPGYQYDVNRTENLSRMVYKFPLLKELFHQNPKNQDVKAEFTDLCFHLSIDILDLVELHPEWEPLHQLGKHLLSISGDLKGKEKTIALLEL